MPSGTVTTIDRLRELIDLLEACAGNRRSEQRKPTEVVGEPDVHGRDRRSEVVYVCLAAGAVTGQAKIPDPPQATADLLALTQAGVSREDAYVFTQRNAMKVWDEGGEYRDLVMNDADVTSRLSPEEIARVFDLKHYLRNVDRVFERVFD